MALIKWFKLHVNVIRSKKKEITYIYLLVWVLLDLCSFSIFHDFFFLNKILLFPG